LIHPPVTGGPTRRRLERWAVFLGKAIFCLALATATTVGTYGGLLVLCERALGIPSLVSHADLIVVLGGDGPRRAAAAASLFESGVAPQVLVSGDGDCRDIQNILISRGVPSAAISIECESRNTMENAEYSAAIMRRMGVHRALLVTSWYHVRRALGSFRKADPGVEFLPVSVVEDVSFWHLAWSGSGSRAVAEYAKIGWYLLRYGVHS
jgi:uncharacterized SAM-binding protein YcdF (DUF218 family)